MNRSGMPEGGVLLYDGACAFCRKSVDVLRRRDKDGRMRYVPLDDDEGNELMQACGMDPQRRDTVVLVEPDGRCSTHSTASLRAMKNTKGPLRLAYALVVVPRPVRDALYRLVSRNRHRLVPGGARR